MHIKICAIGICKDNNITTLISQYTKRMRYKPQIIEIKPSTPIKEMYALLNASEGYIPILLDETGIEYNSPNLLKFLDKICHNTQPKVAFLLGGARGHSEDMKVAVKHHLSLSQLTFPHMLARLILIEQLYRIQTIDTNHPYHK